MINSLFYFVNTEAEYLDDRQNVAPHTIVFCKDTSTIWKNGQRFGGDGTIVTIDTEHSSISYAINDSATQHPTIESQWSTERPQPEQGKYLWTRDITAYTDGTFTITYGVTYFPYDGKGTAIDPDNTYVRYSTQKTQQRPTELTFTLNEPPELEIGDWLWVLNRVTYVGGTSLDSYSVSRVGEDGSVGDPGADGFTTHFAYATSADGSENFNTVNFIGATYIGTYRDQHAEDSRDPSAYTWTKWKGDKGEQGETGEPGEPGSSVEMTEHWVKYAVTDSTNSPAKENYMYTSIPNVSDGEYLWTWTHVKYDNGVENDAYSVSRVGIDGGGIKSAVVDYCQKESTGVSPENFPESDWGDYPTSLQQNWWLYTRTTTTYSDDSVVKSYSSSQIGTGSHYAGAQEYYALGSDGNTVPSGAPTAGTYATGSSITIGSNWSQIRPSENKDLPYIWNFEISSDSAGNRYVTSPICIGNFARGVKAIIELYAISLYDTAGSGRQYPSDISTWSDEHQDAVPTAEKRYQWNKTIVVYTDSKMSGGQWVESTCDVHYHISYTKPEDGTSITSANVYYALTQSSTTTPADSAFVHDLFPTQLNAGYHIWQCTKITMSDGNTSVTAKMYLGSTTDFLSGEEVYAVSTSYTSAPAETTSNWKTSFVSAKGRYLWTATRVTYTNGSYGYLNKKCVGYWGEDGEPGETLIPTMTTQYVLSTDGKNPKSGEDWSTTRPTPAKNEYVLSRTIIKFSDDIQTTIYGAERNPNDGEPGTSVYITEQYVRYAMTSSAVSPAADSEDWKQSYPTIEKGKWLHTKTVVLYSDGNSTITYGVSYVGTDGDTEEGSEGRGISTIVEQYAANNSADTAPTGDSFSTNFPSNWGKDNKYLWNREIVTYTKGNPSSTTSTPVVKTIWTEDGAGIDSIVNYYCANNIASGITTENYTQYTWTTAVQAVTQQKPYLWNYEQINYTQGKASTITSPHVITVFTKNGEPGKDGYSVIVTPSPVILQQNPNDANDYGVSASSPLTISVNVTKGTSSTNLVTSISNVSSSIVNASASGSSINITGVKSDASANGVITATANLTDGSSMTFSVSVGIMKMADFKSTLVDDTLTEVATSFEYNPDSAEGAAAIIENLGKYIKSSKELTADIKSVIGNNTFSGYMSATATNWKAGVKTDINGELSDTGIDITNKKIKLKADNVGIYNNSGVQTFSINNNGDIVSSGAAAFNGKIKAASGDIAGWTIDTGKLHSGTNGTYVELNSASDNTYAMYAGSNTVGNAPFSVTKAGKLTAAGAVISGDITATSGTIGGLTLTDSSISSSNSKFSVTSAGKLTATDAVITGAITATSLSLGSNKISTDNIQGLSTVATSGKYTDLSNKPTIPTKVSDLTDSADYAKISALSGYATSQSVQDAVANCLTQDDLTGYVQSSDLDGYVETNVGLGNASSGSYFLISDTGLLTANNAIITGQVSATSGAIGGILIGNNNIASTNGNFSVTDGGVLTAKSGTVGGWTLGNDYLSSGSDTSYVAINSAPAAKNAYAMWAGNATAANAPFSVTKAGALKATNADISGSITASSITLTGTATIPAAKISGTITATNIAATSGSVGGFTIGEHILSASNSAIQLTSSNYAITLNTMGLICTSADGSTAYTGIYANGAGFLAKGNITWDGSGNISKLKTIQGNYQAAFENGVLTFVNTDTGHDDESIVIGFNEIGAHNEDYSTYLRPAGLTTNGTIESTGIEIKSGNTTVISLSDEGMADFSSDVDIKGDLIVTGDISGATYNASSTGTVSGQSVKRTLYIDSTQFLLSAKNGSAAATDIVAFYSDATGKLASGNISWTSTGTLNVKKLNVTGTGTDSITVADGIAAGGEIYTDDSVYSHGLYVRDTNDDDVFLAESDGTVSFKGENTGVSFDDGAYISGNLPVDGTVTASSFKCANGNFSGELSAVQLLIKDSTQTTNIMANMVSVTRTTSGTGYNVHMAVDSSGKADFQASAGTGNSITSIWPTVNYSNNYDSISLGKVYSLTLGDLKTMIDDTTGTYSTKYGKWSIMLTRSAA